MVVGRAHPQSISKPVESYLNQNLQSKCLLPGQIWAQGFSFELSSLYPPNGDWALKLYTFWSLSADKVGEIAKRAERSFTRSERERFVSRPRALLRASTQRPITSGQLQAEVQVGKILFPIHLPDNSITSHEATTSSSWCQQPENSSCLQNTSRNNGLFTLL